MTSSAVAADELRVLGLQGEPEQVQYAEPDADAPEQRDREAQVDVSSVPWRVRVHEATVLSSIVAVQVTWIAALAYGLALLLR